MTQGKKHTKKLHKKTKTHITDAKKKLLHTEKKLHNYMSKHPEQAALIAAALGAAVGAGIATALRKMKKK